MIKTKSAPKIIYENTFYRILSLNNIFYVHSRYTWTDKWQKMKEYKTAQGALTYVKRLKS